MWVWHGEKHEIWTDSHRDTEGTERRECRSFLSVRKVNNCPQIFADGHGFVWRWCVGNNARIGEIAAYPAELLIRI